MSVRGLVLVLLTLLAGAGVVGGWLLLTDGDGSALGLNADFLPPW
jgi:hypothetical protein